MLKGQAFKVEIETIKDDECYEVRGMKCPVCKMSTGYYPWPTIDTALPTQRRPFPLYQRSYPGEPGYISPRCERCYNKAERKLNKKFSKQP